MPPPLRSALLLAVGFALGIGAASIDRRPAESAQLDTSRVDVRPGAMVGKKGGVLRPLSIRTSDASRAIGDPVSGPAVEKKSTIATVYLTVGDVPVRIDYEVEQDLDH